MKKKFLGAKVAYFGFGVIIFALVCNIVYIGATGKHFYSGAEIEAFAKKRGIAKDIIYAERGTIFSSDGEIVASSLQKYKLIAFVSEKRKGSEGKSACVQDIQKTAQQVAPLIGMDVTEMATKLQTAKDNGSWQIEFGTYGNNLSSLVVKKINETGLPGLEFEKKAARNYPLGDFASYTVGYAKSEEENNIVSMVGEMGIEKNFNEELAGKNGYQLYQIDANQYALPNGLIEEEKAIDGNDVYLTINASLQRALDMELVDMVGRLEATMGSCVVMEAKTGKILAMSNYPSFNPNEREITEHKNFFFEVPFECGSVFKPFVYANLIEDGKYNGNDTYQSGAYEVYDGRPIYDWKKEGWGRISYNDGLALSSNTAIANLVMQADLDSLEEDYYNLGFFTESTVDGFSSPAGIAGFKNNPAKLEYITTGYGQGSTVTALQLLRAYSVFANDGRTVEPYLVDRIVDPNTNEIVYSGKPNYSEPIFSTETITEMNKLLLNNIESEKAVGRYYRLEDKTTKLMGKTGTGEISDGPKGYKKDIYSMSFVGLAPYEDPEIVILSTYQCNDDGATRKMCDLIKKIMPIALATKASYNSAIDTTTQTTYEVDSFTNQSVNYVKSKLENQEMQVEVIGTGNTVVSQFPTATTTLNIGDRIFIKTDGEEITIPKMEGWSRKDVATFASLSGLQIEIEGEVGQVSKQSVAAGTVLHIGETFSVTLQ